jgi:hypothetical protein
MRMPPPQAAYDDVLERLKSQSNELLTALGGNPGCVALGSSDDTALSHVSSGGLQPAVLCIELLVLALM